MKNEDNTIRKSIGFNIEDPDERADLEHAMKRNNFSRYVKQLIHLDRLIGIESILANNSTNIPKTISFEATAKEVSEDDDVISRSSGGFL